ncbi:MAG: two-component sensor histidine kinase [Hyphomonadaceae bacterium]|nr:two-component sensor histidine kinase [Hyphomonadaceae bacterium]MBC6412524.1 two-component sensor histidine kinase [Hyphomonadaceae bacterium]
MYPHIKTYLPKSLFGRALWIIIVPVLVMQIAVAYFFFNAHWIRVTSSLSDSVAADVSVAVELYKQMPGPERAQRLDRMLRPNMELSIALEEADKLPTTTRDAFFSVLDKTLQRALSNALADSFWFDTTRYPNHIDIRVAVDGGVLRFIAARERVFAPTGFVFIFWLVTATVLLTFVSILFILNQARPIRKLADAADAFGKGRDVGNFKPTGASEVRLAGHSFMKMHERIKRHIEQRAILLAGVIHDLRTPLTRLNLHLAMQDDSEEVRAARRDIKDIENMLKAYLDFARGLPGEDHEKTNMKDFLDAIIRVLPEPKPNLVIKAEPNVAIKQIALERALSNLVENGRKYGQACRVILNATDSVCTIVIEDDGPGIDSKEYENAFLPFQRLDTSRNPNVDGVGLGLAVTRDIIQSHGGRIGLGRSDLGGLKVTVNLPL